LSDALFDEAPPFREAEFLLVRLFIAIGPLGGILFELLAPFPISYFHDRGPFLGRHPLLQTGFICRILFPFCLAVGHTFPDKFGQISSGDVLLRRLIGALPLVLLTQGAIAQRLRRLRHTGFASKQQHRE